MARRKPLSAAHKKKISNALKKRAADRAYAKAVAVKGPAAKRLAFAGDKAFSGSAMKGLNALGKLPGVGKRKRRKS